MSESRLSFLKPLTDFLRDCAELSHFRNCGIVTEAEYRLIRKNDNKESAIYIVPLGCKVVNRQSSNNTECGNKLVQEILIVIKIDCASNQNQGIESIEKNAIPSDSDVKLIGPYIKAAEWENEVIKCIRCFNEDEIKKKGHGKILRLIELPQPESDNGVINLPLLYNREFYI